MATGICNNIRSIIQHWTGGVEDYYAVLGVVLFMEEGGGGLESLNFDFIDPLKATLKSRVSYRGVEALEYYPPKKSFSPRKKV